MTRTCYAAPLGACSGGLTREHYISRSVLVAMGSGPTWIEGAQTLPDNSYPADALSVLLEQVATSATSWRILHRLGLAGRQEEIADLESRAQAHSNPSARHDPGTVTDGRLRPPDADRCFSRRHGARYSGAAGTTIHPLRGSQAVRFHHHRSRLEVEPARSQPQRPTVICQLHANPAQCQHPHVADRRILSPVLHPFVIWHLEEDEALVSVETYSAELWVREAADIERYRAVWLQFAEAAQEMT